MNSCNTVIVARKSDHRGIDRSFDSAVVTQIREILKKAATSYSDMATSVNEIAQVAEQQGKCKVLSALLDIFKALQQSRARERDYAYFNALEDQKYGIVNLDNKCDIDNGDNVHQIIIICALACMEYRYGIQVLVEKVCRERDYGYTAKSFPYMVLFNCKVFCFGRNWTNARDRLV